MKKFSLLFSIMVGAALLLNTNIMAQQAGTQTVTMGVDEICLINAENITTGLTFTTATAGAMVATSAATGYVQVSSVIPSGETRKITALLTTLPAGSDLTVTTAVPSNGNQGGTVGTGTTDVALVNAAGAIDLVTVIGSCYTGTAVDDGYALTYTWVVDAANYADLVATSTNVDVTLTLTDGI